MSHTNEMLIARIDELERRLAQLEAKPPRRSGWGIGALMLGLVSAMAFAMSAPAWGNAQDGEKGPQELVCKKLTIVNADGKPRMVLTFNEGGGFIKVMNTEGKNIATISGEKFGGAFDLFGPDEKRSFGVGSNKDGCQLNVRDADGQARGYLGVDGAKEGYLSLKNSKGKTTLYCGEDDDGGLVRVFGHDGKERAFFGVGAKQGDGLLMLYGTDNKRRHWIGSDENGPAYLMHTTGGVLQHDLRGGKDGVFHSMLTPDGKSLIATIGAAKNTGEGILRLNTTKGKNVAYLGSNNNGSGGLILLNTPDDSARVVIGIDGNGVGFGEGRDADNVVRRSLK
jgi:hypothetical protein